MSLKDAGCCNACIHPKATMTRRDAQEGEGPGGLASGWRAVAGWWVDSCGPRPTLLHRPGRQRRQRPPRAGPLRRPADRADSKRASATTTQPPVSGSRHCQSVSRAVASRPVPLRVGPRSPRSPQSVPQSPARPRWRRAVRSQAQRSQVSECRDPGCEPGAVPEVRTKCQQQQVDSAAAHASISRIGGIRRIEGS